MGLCGLTYSLYHTQGSYSRLPVRSQGGYEDNFVIGKFMSSGYVWPAMYQLYPNIQHFICLWIRWLCREQAMPAKLSERIMVLNEGLWGQLFWGKDSSPKSVWTCCLLSTQSEHRTYFCRCTVDWKGQYIQHSAQIAKFHMSYDLITTLKVLSFLMVPWTWSPISNFCKPFCGWIILVKCKSTGIRHGKTGTNLLPTSISYIASTHHFHRPGIRTVITELCSVLYYKHAFHLTSLPMNYHDVHR